MKTWLAKYFRRTATHLGKPNGKIDLMHISILTEYPVLLIAYGNKMGGKGQQGLENFLEKTCSTRNDYVFTWVKLHTT